MALSTTVELTQPVNVMFQQQLLRSVKPRCIHMLGSKAGTINSHNGTFTVTWRSIDNLTPTTTALTALTGNLSIPTRNATQAAVTDVSATVAKYGDFITLNEEADLINFNGQTAKLVEVLSIQAGRSLNRLQRNILEDNATLVRPDGETSDGSVGSAINGQVIKNVVNILNRNSAVLFTPETPGSTDTNTTPTRPAFWGLVHSDVEEDIRDLAKFVPVEQYKGNSEIGEIGSHGGVRWISSPEASIDSNTGGASGGALRSTGGSLADLYTSIVFGKEAAGSVSLDTSLISEVYHAGDDIPGVILIAHGPGSAGTGDPLNEVKSMGWKAWHAGAILRSADIRGIRTAATVLE